MGGACALLITWVCLYTHVENGVHFRRRHGARAERKDIQNICSKEREVITLKIGGGKIPT